MNRLMMIVVVIWALVSPAVYGADKTIGIIVFDDVLTSDITGPAEVFGAASRQSWFNDYQVKLININKEPTITTEEGLTITVDGHIGEPHQLSVLIVPSAYNMKPLLNNRALINFIQTQAKQVDWLSSNCSGAYLLAEAVLLDGKKATTWAGGEEDFQKQYPNVQVQKDQNYVIDTNILTSNGSLVSYLAAIKLLSLMSTKTLAQEVFEALQINRLTASY